MKYLVDRAEKQARYNRDMLPYEYVCWKNTMLDIEALKPACILEHKDLSQADIDELCLYDKTQTWFYDVNTSESFKKMIEELNSLYKNNNFDIDLDKFISDKYDSIYTPEEIEVWKNRFYIVAFLEQLQGRNDIAQKFYSLKDNYAFLTNILRKSIYEYYVLQRWQLKNVEKAANMFRKQEFEKSEFELMQLDMIISTIETKWVQG